MKRLLFITCLALPGICLGQTSESITAKPLIAGSAVDAAADFVPVIDGSVTAGQPALKRLPIDELVDVPGLFASVPNGTFSIAKTNGLQTALDGKQATLVSGTNLKTINGTSLLGSGNLSVSSDLTSGPVTSSGGVSAIADGALSIAKTNGLQTALDGKLTASNIASGTITPKTGDLDFNSLGGAGVTNDTVNTAIGTNPRLTRSAAQADIETASTAGLRNTINNLSTLGNAPMFVFELGDSFRDFLFWDRVARINGSVRCGPANSGGDSGVTTVDDFTRSPNGTHIRIASGGNLTCGHLLHGVSGPARYCYYTFFKHPSSAGTATIEYSLNGAAWSSSGLTGNVIDTNAIAADGVAIGKVDLGQTHGLVRWRVRATGGNVDGWIGQGVDGPGITLVPLGSQSGTEIEQCASVTETIWKAMIEGYFETGGSQLITVTFADDRYVSASGTPYTKGADRWAATGSGPMNNLYTWAKTQRAACDFMIFGPHQVDATHLQGSDATLDPLYIALGVGNSGLNTNDRIIDGAKAQRDFAVTKREAYVDFLSLWTYAQDQPSGVYDDQIHASDKGSASKWAWAMKTSALGAVHGQLYRSRQRLGNGAIQAIAARSQGLTSAGYFSTDSVPQLLPWTTSQLRLGSRLNPESVGGAVFTDQTGTSPNSLFFGSYTYTGGSGLAQNWEMNYANSDFTPALNNGGRLGTITKRVHSTHTSGLNLGYSVKTADFTLPANNSEYLLHYKTAPFTVTLPLSNGAWEQGSAGRIYVIKNTAASGVITINTQSDGTNLQKINDQTSITVPAAGGTVTIVSVHTASNVTSANYGNWITL